MVMVLPMSLLGVGAVLVGLSGSPWLQHPFFRLLGTVGTHEGLDASILLLSTLGAGAGIWLAWAVGMQRRNLLPAGLRPLGARLYRLAAGKYYIDELYDRLIIAPFLEAARRLSRFDLRVIDGAVNGAGAAGWSVSQWKERFDRLIVDRAINTLARVIRGIGDTLRWLQTGIVQQYLLVVVIAVVTLSVVLRQ